jgi:RimJ/RimL family protein N-acetyltransferase
MADQPFVSIRSYRLEDGPALFEAVIESRRELAPWMPWCHPAYSIDDARNWVELQVGNFREGREYDFVIVSPGGRFLGACGLNQFDLPNRRANLGYWVRSSETGRGVAVAAVRQLARWAFENTDFNRLEIIAAVGNERSQRVAERAGAEREGVLLSRLMLHDRMHDAAIYSFVRG